MRAHWGGLGLLVLGAFGIARVAAAQPLPCREDDRLSETAASLLLSGESLNASTLLVKARASGFDGVSVRARESADDGALRAWLDGVRATGEGELVCGEARAESRRLVLASLRGGTLQVRGELVVGELERGFTRPSLVVERADGSLTSHALETADLHDGVQIEALAQVRRVQLVAESASGPRPVAELSWGAANTGDASSEGPEQAAGELSDAQLFARLNESRRHARVPNFRDNRLLSESARRHATRLCASGKLVHRLEGEDPEERLAREHIAARSAGEVLARAGSSGAAVRVLLASPSHRLALSRRDFTDVGVGRAIDRKGQTCLVVLTAGWPRRTP